MRYSIILFFLLISQLSFSQTGNFNCKLDGTAWHGNCVGALYSESGDYIDLNFDGPNNSGIQLNVRFIKSQITAHIPYIDFYEYDYKNFHQQDVYLYVIYYPDKRHPDMKSYKMLSGQMRVDKCDFTTNKFSMLVEAECGLASVSGTNYIVDPNQKISIKEGATDEIVFTIIH